METTYVYKASKLNDFLGLLACGAAALSISISIAYGDRHEEASDVKKIYRKCQSCFASHYRGCLMVDGMPPILAAVNSCIKHDIYNILV